MNDLIIKYYGINKKTREEMDLIYAYHVLTDKLKNKYERMSIPIVELEDLMQIIQRCTELTDYSMDCIVDNILEVINCKDISITELKGLTDDELLEVLFYEYEEQEEDEFEDEEIEEQQTKEKNVEEIQETQIIQGVLTEFCFEDYYCILCAFKDKYIVILMNSNCVRGIVLNSVEGAFDGTLARKLRDLEFYD